MHAVIWTCLDKNGQDACRISKVPNGWNIEGSAVFCHQNNVACLSYHLACDDSWCSTMALVKGWLGTRNIEVSIVRQTCGRWFINGQHDASLDGLLDIDLGFTPASNTNALRRLNLKASETASTVTLWLDSEDWTVKKLYQEYSCIAPCTYDYTSPLHDYHAILKTTDFGIISDYPGLWRMLNHVEYA